MIVAATATARDVQIVGVIPFNDLREGWEVLAPGYDFGNQGVEVWAADRGGCFEDPGAALRLFHRWVDETQQTRMTGAVDIVCRRSGDGSAFVILMERTRAGCPEELHLFRTPAPNSEIGEKLFSRGVPGYDDFFIDFVVSDGRVIGLAYLADSIREEYHFEPIDLSGRDTPLFTAVYELHRIDTGDSVEFLVLGERALMMEPATEIVALRFGREVTELASSRLIQSPSAAKAADELRGVRAVLETYQRLIEGTNAQRIFHTGTIEVRIRSLEYAASVPP